MSTIYKYFSSIFITLLLCSCMAEKETQLDPNLEYTDFVPRGAESLEIDESISDHTVEIPTPKKVDTWHSSNFSLNEIPQNLYAKTKLKKPKVKTYKLNSGSSSYVRENIVVANRIIYTLSKGTVYAHNLAKPSKLLWKKSISQEAEKSIGGGIYYRNNSIAVTTGGKEVILLNSANGKEIWRYTLSNISRSTPLIYDGKVYVLTIDNALHCIDFKTGFADWGAKEAHENLGFLGGSSPEAYKESIIMPFSSGKILAINKKTGQGIWSATLSGALGDETYVNDIDMVPVIKDDTVYISSHNGILYAINAARGSLEWANRYAGGYSQVWVADDYIYTINKNNQLLAIYKVTGSIKWAVSLEAKSKKKKESIFFSENTTLFSGPTMINGHLYVPSSDGNLLIFNAVNGKKLGSIKINKGIGSPVLAVDDKIYLMNSNGTLTVIGD